LNLNLRYSTLKLYWVQQIMKCNRMRSNIAITKQVYNA